MSAPNNGKLSIVNLDLDDFVNEPRETLDVEIKEWLDLSVNAHRAKIAKAIIALANHGGGFIIVGFEEQRDGTFEAATPRPTNLDAWSQDSIQDIAAKYIDQGIQCRVAHRVREFSHEKHPVIIVPGGHRIPIRAKAGSPDGKELVPHKIYIRRAGPKSEEPQNADEWNNFFERIIQNRQEELLNAMRSIMAGILPLSGKIEVATQEDLKSFSEAASRSWEKHTSKLTPGTPAKLEHGYYDAAFAIDGEFDKKSLGEMRNIIEQAVRNHSGWPPFLTLHHPPHNPKPIDNTIECWVGPGTPVNFDKPSRHDFWRASPLGFFFTRRGYPEDNGFNGMAPGANFDITTPTWRLGEAILQVMYIANALNSKDANLICNCSWLGLKGRQLVSVGNPNRIWFSSPSAQQNDFSVTESIALSSLPNSLPDLVFRILGPLYELFEFTRLDKRMIEEELASMQKNRF